MRGKKPKEREKYVIRMGNGTLVEVDREIYLEWYRSERRKRYQKERDRKYGVMKKDISLDNPLPHKHATQEAVLRNECRG